MLSEHRLSGGEPLGNAISGRVFTHNRAQELDNRADVPERPGMISVILALHLFTTFALTGLIWVIQVVHYPAFREVPPTRRGSFAADHARRITWIVAPLMIGEALSAGILWELWTSEPRLFAATVLIAFLWGVTFRWSVPCHTRIQRDGDPVGESTEALIRTNWARTLLWSLRSVIWLWWLIEFAGAALNDMGPVK